MALAPVIRFSQEQVEHTNARIRYWDKYANAPGPLERTRRSYQRRLIQNLPVSVPPGLRELELGSGTGDLLAGLQPARGVGVDFPPAAIQSARASPSRSSIRRNLPGSNSAATRSCRQTAKPKS